MENWIIQIDDENGGKGRKIYLTSWGTSVWIEHAKNFEQSEAKKQLSEYLKSHERETGRLINYGTKSISPLHEKLKSRA